MIVKRFRKRGVLYVAIGTPFPPSIWPLSRVQAAPEQYTFFVNDICRSYLESKLTLAATLSQPLSTEAPRDKLVCRFTLQPCDPSHRLSMAVTPPITSSICPNFDCFGALVDRERGAYYWEALAALNRQIQTSQSPGDDHLRLFKRDVGHDVRGRMLTPHTRRNIGT